MLFTKSEISKHMRIAQIVCVAAVIHFLFHKSWWSSAGAAWILFTTIDYLLLPIGIWLTPQFSRPISFKGEGTEASKGSYQYILTLKDGKKVCAGDYSYPYDKVQVELFKLHGHYFTKVSKRR